MTIITGPVKTGIGLWLLTRRELIPTLPVDAPMIVAAVVTAFLYSEIGIAGLFPWRASFLAASAGAHPLARWPDLDLTVREATARYAGGIAGVLGLSSSQRRSWRCRLHLDGRARLTRLDDFGAVMRTVLYPHECWAGGGRLGLVAGDRIPIESRVLAVAHTWAGLRRRADRA